MKQEEVVRSRTHKMLCWPSRSQSFYALTEKDRILLYDLKPRHCKHMLAEKKDHSYSIAKKAGGGIID